MRPGGSACCCCCCCCCLCSASAAHCAEGGKGSVCGCVVAVRGPSGTGDAEDEGGGGWALWLAAGREGTQGCFCAGGGGGSQGAEAAPGGAAAGCGGCCRGCRCGSGGCGGALEEAGRAERAAIWMSAAADA